MEQSKTSPSWAEKILRRKYLALLVTLIALLLVYPTFHEYLTTRVFFDLLATGVFAAAIFAIFTKRSSRLLAMVFGAPLVLALWLGYVVPGLPRHSSALISHSIAICFFIVVVVTILISAFKEKVVAADHVYGAFCAYMLIGLIFGHAYCIIEHVNPNAFVRSEALATRLDDEVRRQFQLTYFSLVTLTTVGYGDITPAWELARGLAVAEAIIGQFYIAVLIAELIGKRVAQALTEPGNDTVESGGTSGKAAQQ